MQQSIFQRFWSWYERHYKLTVGITNVLFIWQLIHLYWLTTDVVMHRILGRSFFHPTGIWEVILVVVDYTEIPALISASILYIHEYQKKKSAKSILALLALNSQWLHLFWITDEVVVNLLTAKGAFIGLPVWLAWVAILIDYLEVPVIFDTMRKFLASFRHDRDPA